MTEHALAGSDETVRERSLGVEALGRAPDYDTEADPVVRVTFSEIRRRLSQYYTDPEHAGELRICPPPGSYLPEFSKAPNGVAHIEVLAPEVVPHPPVLGSAQPNSRSRVVGRR